MSELTQNVLLMVNGDENIRYDAIEAFTGAGFERLSVSDVSREYSGVVLPLHVGVHSLEALNTVREQQRIRWRFATLVYVCPEVPPFLTGTDIPRSGLSRMIEDCVIDLDRVIRWLQLHQRQIRLEKLIVIQPSNNEHRDVVIAEQQPLLASVKDVHNMEVMCHTFDGPVERLPRLFSELVIPHCGVGEEVGC